MIRPFLFLSLLWMLLCFNHAQSHTLTRIDGTFDKIMAFSINTTVELLIEFPNTNTRNPFRIATKCASSSVKFPILISVKQEQQVISWQIPMILKLQNKTLNMAKTARTLCYDEDEYTDRNLDSTFRVYLSTASVTTQNVTLLVTEVKDYYISKDKNYTVSISPSEPVFFYYPDDKNETKLPSFIEVNSPDDICLTVSVQNSICPVRDLNKDIEHEGRYQTMIRKGGLFIKKDEFPNGFFLAFVAKGDNAECTKNMLPAEEDVKYEYMNRTTIIQFNVHRAIQSKEYVKPILAIFGIYLAFCLTIIILVVIAYKHGNIKNYFDAVFKNGGSLVNIPNKEPEGDQLDLVENLESIAHQIKDKHYKIADIKVIHLTTDETRSNKKSYNYVWHITNIGLFYGIPVVQLMVSYQKRVHASGDEDICYHNFYCSRPLFGFTDFNHIYSNIGYVMVGILFLCITCFRQIYVKQQRRRGIPQHYGMYYAMGIALMLEGFMSACYHICPSQMNFQFDTSFMYIMAALCMVKLYQNRHPDVNASAYGTFTILGFFVFIAMLGILLNSKTLMALFMAGYIVLCFYLSFKIYFFGEVLEGFSHYYKKYRGAAVPELELPFRRASFLALVGVNVLNFSGTIIGIIFYPTVLNFASFLLAIFMGNLVLYIAFYIVMKIANRERLCWEARIYGVLVAVCWGFSSAFFFNPASRWEVSPAESKMLNNDCTLMNFYDQHDIWHMLSAPALIFSFLMLMCLDDDLFITPQNEITVF